MVADAIIPPLPQSAPRSARRTRATVLRLALADLGHEWVLTLCLVLALAAVISPLLILMGLKHGTVETLRCALVQDPAYREIRPAETRAYDPLWFATWGKRPEVGFLTPTILPASSIIGAAKPDAPGTQFLDLIPTGAGDPLILENGGAIPGAGEVVLTQVAAEGLGVQAGDTLELRATRSRGGQPEQGVTRVRVAAVLGQRAGTLARVYAPLGLVLDVESYKEGMAVPGRGWDGGSPTPYASFDGILVLVPEPLTAVQRAGLSINTGLTRSDPLTAEAFRLRTGLPVPPDFHVYELGIQSGAIQMSSVRTIKDKLRGTGAILLPYVTDTSLRFAQANGEALAAPVFGLSVSADDAARLGLTPPPWGALRGELGDSTRLLQVLLPAGSVSAASTAIEAEARPAGGTLHFTLAVAGPGVTGVALVPTELLGVLRTATDRPITYDLGSGRFLLARTGFQGFRLYARFIDDVAGLERDLRREGIDVIAQGQAIERIRILDRGLTRVFWLVAVVGITGGFAALIASLYAAVQRKRRELGVMRLLGLARLAVFRFPIYQGTTIAGLSILLAILGYLALAMVINQVFAADLAVASQACRTAQRICALPNLYLPIAVVATVIVALVSSLVAAWKTTRIDPAEALREE
ncbi:ABC transporter permease [uncultured Lamprocystis sp.]|jgi:putative ABC transport system permease protein|uniref:ABC transporter permease n=1 Tax=uncultured Lamprocystis sp. TaxID=543132 RepID=UPI0025D7A79A|nr:ABC transporter permease [uncultured Lamprocystis sp.]